MLVEFQQALADLVASPELCRRVRADGGELDRRYRLSARERGRLLGVVTHRGMGRTCTLYRANRLAPLALNLPHVCRTLAGELPAVLDDYWTAHPSTDVHFLVESERFCAFLAAELARGRPLPAGVAEALDAERPVLALRLAASRTEAPPRSEAGEAR